MELDEAGEIRLNGGDESSLLLTKNPEAQNRTKHSDVQHHYIHELIHGKKLLVARYRAQT